jgi:hypothetical protein
MAPCALANQLNQVGRDRPVNDVQNLAHCLGMGSEQVSSRKRKTDNPLPRWYIGKYFIREKGCGLGHTAGATAGAESASLAAESNEPLEVALIGAYAQDVFQQPKGPTTMASKPVPAKRNPPPSA